VRYAAASEAFDAAVKIVFLHDRQPMSEILRVIGAGLVGDLKSGTKEGDAKLCDKLFYRIGVIAEALSKLPVAATKASACSICVMVI
jgi:hypothetical protein